MNHNIKNWCGVDGCSGHPDKGERHLIDMVTGRYTCCGTDALRADAFHAAGCPNRALAAMQTPEAKAGVAAAFGATPEALSAAAVKAAQAESDAAEFRKDMLTLISLAMGGEVDLDATELAMVELGIDIDDIATSIQEFNLKRTKKLLAEIQDRLGR